MVDSAPVVSGENRRSLSTGRVVFLVIAAAAPLAAMVGNVPLALIDGNGVGLPVAFLIATLVLLCFSVGYAAMSRRVVNTGAFYTYIARALGKPAGIGSAYVAVVAYAGLTCGLVGAFGYFTRLVLLELGIDIPWYLSSALAVVIIGLLGYRSADLSAKVLGTLMIAEFAVLVIFDLLVVGEHGGDAFPAVSFTGVQVFSGSIGIALMFAFTSFVGFESAALYGEETKNPERSIPRATYIAVVTIGIFYILTTWIIIGAAGGTQAPELAGEQLGNFVFNLILDAGGTILYDLAAVLFCTSVLASALALHNAASRYLFALGRERVVPAQLGKYHPRHQSPYVASLWVTGLAAVSTLAMALFGADPYTVFATSFIGLGTLGIIALQAAAALAVVVFFWRRPDRNLWRCIIAPLIGFVGLATGFTLAVTHYSTLTGSTNMLVDAVPALLIVAAVAGVVVALRLRRREPAVYAAIAASQLRRRRQTVSSAAPVGYQRRYCVVGAGPAGLLMARALAADGVPFDWYERNSDVGGIWDIDAPGGPMYSSAHFISSKYTSGFFGYPMPDDYPDYPSWRQIRDYIRGFALHYGLYEKVTLSVAVTRAEPITGDRWEVTLSTGEVKQYDGLIAAPGVTWHPNVPAIPGAESFLDPALLTWKQGHPDLYLNVFSRELDSLYVLGFAEFADAAYRRFDEMVQLVVMDIKARETGVHQQDLRELKRTDHPDLRGGVAYPDSPRHANYVENHTYQAYLADLRDRFDWPDPGEASYPVPIREPVLPLTTKERP